MMDTDDATLIQPTAFTELGSPDALAQLYLALAKAQGEFSTIHRSRTVTIQPREGRAYSFAYAPLEDLLAATRPALTANGLAVITPVVKLGDSPCADAMVIVAHEGGARIMASFAFTPQGDMKTVAGQWSYLRRYGYSSMLNLAADDDADDAPAAPPTSDRPARASTEASKRESAVDKINAVRLDDSYADGTSSRVNAPQVAREPNAQALREAPAGMTPTERAITMMAAHKGPATPEHLATYDTGMAAAAALGLGADEWAIPDRSVKASDLAVIISSISAACQAERARLKELPSPPAVEDAQSVLV